MNLTLHNSLSVNEIMENSIKFIHIRSFNGGKTVRCNININGGHHAILVDNNLSVNEIMENESLFHDTMRQPALCRGINLSFPLFH